MPLAEGSSKAGERVGTGVPGLPAHNNAAGTLAQVGMVLQRHLSGWGQAISYSSGGSDGSLSHGLSKRKVRRRIQPRHAAHACVVGSPGRTAVFFPFAA